MGSSVGQCSSMGSFIFRFGFQQLKTVMYLGVFITFVWLQIHWTWIFKLIAPKFRKVFFFNYFFSFFFSPSTSLPFLQNSTSKVAQVVKNLPACAGAVEMWVWSLGRRVPWRRKMATHSSISCLKNCMDQGVWQAAIHGVAKRQTRLSIHTPLSRVTAGLSPQPLRLVFSCSCFLSFFRVGNSYWSVKCTDSFLL